MNTNDRKDQHRDPITGEPGSHPVGLGMGAVSGALAGAVIGAVGGPVGLAAGAVVGAVAGGMAGKATAEAIDETVEDRHWRDQYRHEPYHDPSRPYGEFAPAYRIGYQARVQYTGKEFSDIESELARRYEIERGSSTVSWTDARPATYAAWNRAERAVPGDLSHGES